MSVSRAAYGGERGAGERREEREPVAEAVALVDHVADASGEGVVVAAGTGGDEQSQQGAQRGDAEELVLGLTRFIAGTGSALTCTNVVDMVGDVRIQNQPGTNAEQYKNWCVPLSNSDGEPVLIEDLTSIDLFARVAEASARR